MSRACESDAHSLRPSTGTHPLDEVNLSVLTMPARHATIARERESMRVRWWLPLRSRQASARLGHLVAAVAAQEVDHRLVVVRGGKLQRRLLVVRQRVDVGAVRDEELHDGKAVVVGGVVQRCMRRATTAIRG